MNIFLLSYLVNEAAKAHYNRHVVKMISETFQLISTAYAELDANLASELGTDCLWKPTHKNHPCAIWARAHPNNLQWLIALGFALCEEYTLRFSDAKEPCKKHAVEERLRKLSGRVPNFASELPPLNEFGVTEPPQCMPDKYKVAGNAVEAYRAYYAGEEKMPLRWWRPAALPVSEDDRDQFTPPMFAGMAVTPQKNFLGKLERIERKRAKAAAAPPGKRAKKNTDTRFIE
jgi:hypothetical protein